MCEPLSTGQYRNKKVKRPECIIILCLLAAEVSAVPLVYENLTGSAMSVLGWQNADIWVRQGQTFTLSDPAYISMAEFDLIINSAETYTCRLVESDLNTVIAETSGFISSPDLTDWERFVFGSSPLVPAGDYAITLQAGEVSLGVIDAIYRAASGDPFPGGDRGSSVGGAPWVFSSDTDCLFRFTFTPVPEPFTTALVVMGAGVLALAHRSHRRKP
jgi:hypothetical protein